MKQYNKLGQRKYIWGKWESLRNKRYNRNGHCVNQGRTYYTVQKINNIKLGILKPLRKAQ